MNYILSESRKRKALLLTVINDCEKWLEHAPIGHLRINGNQLYCRTDPKDTNGTYIRKKNICIAKKLAKKDYLITVLQAARAEYSCLEGGRFYTGNRFEDIYEHISLIRQKLIDTDYVSDKLYAQRWASQEYHRPGFKEGSPEFYTDSGIRVRSKSEVIIANQLHKYGLLYRYECPVVLDNGQIRYPDFTILIENLRKLVYWEHLGMVSDPKYMSWNINKLNDYSRIDIVPGDNLITTLETPECPLNTRSVERIIAGLKQW